MNDELKHATTGAPRRTTINDIAKRVGLSKASVSRALNGKQDVDPETRKRVLTLAADMGYVASASARALSNGRSNYLGLLVPTLTWPWILEVLRGVAEEIERSGYSLILYTTTDGEDSERAFMSQVVPAGAVDGLACLLPSSATPSRGFCFRAKQRDVFRHPPLLPNCRPAPPSRPPCDRLR